MCHRPEGHRRRGGRGEHMMHRLALRGRRSCNLVEHPRLAAAQGGTQQHGSGPYGTPTSQYLHDPRDERRTTDAWPGRGLIGGRRALVDGCQYAPADSARRSRSVGLAGDAPHQDADAEQTCGQCHEDGAGRTGRGQ